MALIRVAQYSSTPGPVTDYQAQNAHLQAFTNQLMTQQFILDSGTDQPVIKQGCYVSHGGSLYVADADTPITGSPGDGSVYIRVSGTTTLTVEFVTNISGYVWNPVYTALTSGSYTLLPYLIVKASTVWTRYNFNPNNHNFGAIKATDVVTPNGPNKPVDNNDASMPSVGIGGFSYAVGSITGSGYPSATIGSGGTWVYIAHSTRAVATSYFETRVGRIAGGSSVQGSIPYSPVDDDSGLVYVIAWRIA